MKSEIPKIVNKYLDDTDPSSSPRRSRDKKKSEKLVQKVWDWIVHTLPTPSEDYNNMPPCPYARVALSSGQVLFHTSDDITSAIDIKSAASDYGELHHVLIWTDPFSMSPDEMIQWMREQNKNHFGIWMMGMHPDHPDAELSVWESLGMDDWGIILVQQLHELDMAHRVLLKTQYYTGVEEVGDLVERRMCSDAWNEKASKEIVQEISKEEEEVIH